jgi:hypothetical protein
MITRKSACVYPYGIQAARRKITSLICQYWSGPGRQNAQESLERPQNEDQVWTGAPGARRPSCLSKTEIHSHSTCGIEEVAAMNSENGPRPLALVTGASRRKGIGAGGDQGGGQELAGSMCNTPIISFRRSSSATQPLDAPWSASSSHLSGAKAASPAGAPASE